MAVYIAKMRWIGWVRCGWRRFCFRSKILQFTLRKKELCHAASYMIQARGSTAPPNGIPPQRQEGDPPYPS